AGRGIAAARGAALRGVVGLLAAGRERDDDGDPDQLVHRRHDTPTRAGRHTGAMSVVIELVGAIEADPQDPGPQLVLADHLLSAEDPRGELIVLDHRDRTDPDGLTDPAALERILLLAAVYGFPCAREPELPELLPFVGGGGYPVQYDLDHE